MVKKIFALVMVMSILGGIVAGCGEKPAEDPAAPATGTEEKAPE